MSDSFVIARRSGAGQLRAVRVESHASDSADVDFVLHAVSVEQAGVDFTHQFSGLDIPVLDHTLQISRNQTLTVRMKRNVINMAVMTEHFLMKLLSRIRMPDSDGAIIADAGYKFSVRTGRDFADRTLVSLERKQWFWSCGSIGPHDELTDKISGHRR